MKPQPIEITISVLEIGAELQRGGRPGQVLVRILRAAGFRVLYSPLRDVPTLEGRHEVLGEPAGGAMTFRQWLEEEKEQT